MVAWWDGLAKTVPKQPPAPRTAGDAPDHRLKAPDVDHQRGSSQGSASVRGKSLPAAGRVTVPGHIRPKLLAVDDATRGAARQKATAKSTSVFEWVRSSNGPDDREERRRVSRQTIAAVQAGGYTVGGGPLARLAHVADCVRHTAVVSPTQGCWPGSWREHGDDDDDVCSRLRKGRRRWPEVETVVTVASAPVLCAAADRTRQGQRVAAVSAASAYHVGGGFSSGGRHALEEAICTQSTLYASLQAVARRPSLSLRPASAASKRGSAPDWAVPSQASDGKPWQCHIPYDGAVISPDVEVFRKGTYAGYVFDDQPCRLEAVVSIAMPNRNPSIKDAPVDAHPDVRVYAADVAQKWRAALAAAAYLAPRATVLVVPDAGCGVFHNPPALVGAALGRLLREEFVGRFAEVIIAIPGRAQCTAFADAVKSAASGVANPAPAMLLAQHRPATKARPSSGSGSQPGDARLGGSGCAVAPAACGVPASGGPTQVAWEFESSSGYMPFTHALLVVAESLYERFLSSGRCTSRAVAAVPCADGKSLRLDFSRMTQRFTGSNRVRRIRRREVCARNAGA